MNTTIQKWGNSYAVRLPKDLVRRRRFTEGTTVVVSEQDDSILIRSVPVAKRLADLVRGITPSTRHGEQVWGAVAGNEVW